MKQRVRQVTSKGKADCIKDQSKSHHGERLFASKRKTNCCEGKNRLHKKAKQNTSTRKIVRNKEKGRLHHCDPPLIRELFKKSSYYQYLFLCKYRIKFILFYHHMAARRRSFRGRYRIKFILSFHLILFIILFFRCCECITHQRTDGHWTNTTRHGCNKRAFGSYFFELHITIKAKSVLLS